MANVFDYLTWRADVPFVVSAFNEVDNLILAELAYTDFSGIVNADGDAVTLADACEQFFQIHSKDEILKSNSFTAKAALLMEPMLTGDRFGKLRLCRYINEIDTETTTQLSALTFLLDDGTAYVAYRGTDSTVVGWKEDFDIGCLSETVGQQRAVEYLEETAATFELPFRVGGHSKGGNFAVFASSFCRSETQARILTVYNNDGPGFRDEVVAQPGYLHILPKIISIVPDTSMIGMILANKSKKHVIKSTANGIFQHDGFSWSVQRDRFEPAETSELGKLMDQILSSWIDGMDDETRTSATDTLFSLFEATGADTFHEMSQQKLKSAESIFNTLRTTSREKQTELLRLAGELVKSGGQAALEKLPEMVFQKKEENGEESQDAAGPIVQQESESSPAISAQS